MARKSKEAGSFMVAVCPGFILNFKLMFVDCTEVGVDRMYQLVHDDTSKLLVVTSVPPAISTLASASSVFFTVYTYMEPQVRPNVPVAHQLSDSVFWPAAVTVVATLVCISDLRRRVTVHPPEKHEVIMMEIFKFSLTAKMLEISSTDSKEPCSSSPPISRP